MKIGLILLVICGHVAYSQTGSMTDARDGRVYKTVQIGQQVWMGENLTYTSDTRPPEEHFFCYDNLGDNCAKYGVLYNWQAAKNACPDGWRLPSKEDFEMLLKEVGQKQENLSEALREGGSSGFNGMFAGWLYFYGKGRYSRFMSLGKTAMFWTSTPHKANKYSYRLGFNTVLDKTSIVSTDINNSFSVRCLKD